MGALGVRDGEPILEARGNLPLALLQVGSERLGRIADAEVRSASGHEVENRCLVGETLVQKYLLSLYDVGHAALRFRVGAFR